MRLARGLRRLIREVRRSLFSSKTAGMGAPQGSRTESLLTEQISVRSRLPSVNAMAPLGL